MMMRTLYWFIPFYVIVCALTIIFFNGTGDSGDSVAHYLFARYAPAHPELYFHHWAKPLYVLLASPFAQFGFIGIKIFNCLNTLAAILVTYRLATALKLENVRLIPVFMLFSPLYYILTFSGLTEPLFALLTAIAMLLCVERRYLAGCLVISFLPYVRSEGLIIIGTFAVYLLYLRLWQHLPLLLAGSAAYAVAGYFYYHDILWVFTKIPYATLGSEYGSGRLFHFVEEFINVVGVPLYALFWTGFCVLVYSAVRRKVPPEIWILCVFGFASFFVAHTLFWYMGIFNSMGLKRVFLGIMPMIAVIALAGFNFVVSRQVISNDRVRRLAYGVLLAYVLVFPFTPNPSAIQWRKDMTLETGQVLAAEMAGWLMKNRDIRLPLIYDHQQFSMLFNLDHFDPSAATQLTREALSSMKKGDILIWDNQYTEKYGPVKKAELDASNELVSIHTVAGKERGREFSFVAYEKR
jgi:hypothetical protein